MNKDSLRMIESSESSSNHYVVRTMVFGVLTLVIACVLNELGVYHVDRALMYYATIGVFVITLATMAFVAWDAHRNLPATKYIVILGTFFITLCETTVLSFFAVPLIVYPMMVGAHFHSRRINFCAIMASCICAVLSPLLGFYFQTWDHRFYIWLLSVYKPGLIPESVLNSELSGLTLPDSAGVWTFVAIPNLLYIACLGVLSYTINLARRKRQEKEVKKVLNMQDSVLYSMADIIENRDFNTGGHVKRTSELMKIMSEWLKKNPIPGDEKRDESFYEAVIKGAPLHDLGKITISDTILCKPSKLTDEEFEKIKTHPVQSARIIDQVLSQIEGEYLLSVTKNIALYHHERYDGSGYPDGLSGDSIPLEARMMAIADVYDALVSERCYKDAMTSEEAYNTITESMGTHFDPKLRDCFEASFPKFLKFYN